MVAGRAILALVGTVALGACGSGGGGGGGGGGEACAPTEGTTRAGTAELGRGIERFEPIGSSLQFVTGTQGGTFLFLHARMQGLTPGNDSDPSDPSNPQTAFRVVFEDGEVVETCPTKLGYVDTEDGYFTLSRPFMMPFLPYEVGERAFDSDLTVSVEIVDAELRTARAEATVFAQRPPEAGGPLFDASPAPRSDAASPPDAAPDGL